MSMDAAASLPRESWRGVPVAVVGLGRSNLALIRHLLKRGAAIVGCDRKPLEALDPEVRELAGQVALRLGEDYLEVLRERPFDTIFLTPGMKKDLPEIRAARAAGTRVRGEVDLFLELCRAPVIGVTGSAGKTTTSCLIAEGLRRALGSGPGEAGRRVYLGGNIGQPLIEEVDRIGPDAVVVLELSSFQLELVQRAPSIGVVLNLRPNHLDVHGSLQEYADAKARLVRLQDQRGWAVLNAADDFCAGLAREAPGGVAVFGPDRRSVQALAESVSARRGHPVRAGYLVDGALAVWDGHREQHLLGADQLHLRGLHNRLNVLAAVLAGWLAGADPAIMAQAAAAFPGVEHRLEFVREVDGVRYYNDSIATAPDRTLAALASFSEPVVLIAGGYDKGISLEPLGPALCRRARAVIVMGQTAGQLERVVSQAAAREGRGPVLRRAASLPEAVRQARQLARPGDVVLLSPACASYDMFRDYAERGRLFKQLVAGLPPRGAAGSTPG